MPQPRHIFSTPQNWFVYGNMGYDAVNNVWYDLSTGQRYQVYGGSNYGQRMDPVVRIGVAAQKAGFEQTPTEALASSETGDPNAQLPGPNSPDWLGAAGVPEGGTTQSWIDAPSPEVTAYAQQLAQGVGPTVQVPSAPLPEGIEDITQPPEIPDVAPDNADMIAQDTSQTPADVWANLSEPTAPWSEPDALTTSTATGEPTVQIPVPAPEGWVIGPDGTPMPPLTEPQAISDWTNIAPSPATPQVPSRGPMGTWSQWNATDPHSMTGIYSTTGPFSTPGVGPQYSSDSGTLGLGFDPNAQANPRVGLSMHPSSDDVVTGLGGEPGEIGAGGLADQWQGWQTEDLQNFVNARRTQGHSGQFQVPSYLWSDPNTPEYIPLSTPILSRQGPQGGKAGASKVV